MKLQLLIVFLLAFATLSIEHYYKTGTKEVKPKISGGALRTIAYVLLAEGKTTAALSVFQKKVAWFPDSSSNEVDLAKVYAVMGDKTSTELYLRKALDKDSQNTRALILAHQLNLKL